ncbi:MAG TPA: slipin family protein [Thermoanaerobaculia bacterium]|nr:slipin family protein [Thermoanaerobaculia bacterium]
MVPIAIMKKKEEKERSRSGADPLTMEANRGGSRRFVNPVSLTVATIFWIAGIAVAAIAQDEVRSPVWLMVFASLGLYALFSIKIADQWEKGFVLRLGRFRGLRGPGFFTIIPIVDQLSHLIDQRVRVTDVTAESALTRDTVPVDVDAIVFWTVWDAQKAVLEVSDYFVAIALSAQTGLREAIGRHELAEMITERDRLGGELRRILDDKTNPWGITIHSVEIRDVKIPQGLEEAMSRQAQAERERQARIILGTAETEIASRFVKAGDEYHNKPVALHLRAMNMLYEAIKEKGSMVIVPSSAVETMGLGGLSGLTALGGGSGVPGRVTGAPEPGVEPEG